MTRPTYWHADPGPTRAEISVERDGVTQYLTVEGERVEYSSHEPLAMDLGTIRTEDGAEWDGTLCATETARAIFALCEAERQAYQDQDVSP